MKGFFWCLEAMTSSAAVLAEWREVSGPEFDLAQRFLRPTERLAETVPCRHEPRCDCRHEVVELEDGKLRAVCRCELGNCPTVALRVADVVVHELDTSRLCEAVRGVLDLDGPKPGPLAGARHCWRVGTLAPNGWPVVLCVASDEVTLLSSFSGAVAVLTQPLVLLTPAGTHFTPRVEAVVRQHRSVHLPLARWTKLAEGGGLVRSGCLDPVLETWEREVARGQDIGKLLAGLHEEIGSVRTEYRETRRIKERLEQMQGEKLFAFADGIDPESFRVLCSILAHGDVAKASRALNLNDATLRSRMADWKRKGPTYRVLVELVRWRKAIGRKGTVPLDDSVTKGTAAQADFQGLLSDVLDEVLEMTEDTWEEKAEALAELLRPHVAR